MYNFINTTCITIAGFSRGHCEVYVCVGGGGVTVHHEPSKKSMHLGKQYKSLLAFK